MSGPNGRARQVRPSLAGLVDRPTWLGLLALAAIAVTVASFAAAQRGSARMVEHSEAVTRLMRRGLRLAVDRETGVRGYLITRDSASLAPEIEAREPLRVVLDSLVALTADNPPQRRRAEGARLALARWEREFARPALLDPDVAGRTDLAGKSRFDDVRAHFAAFYEEEEALSAERHAREARLVALGLIVVAAEIALALASLIVLGRRARARAMAIAEQQEHLETQATELEEQAIELEEQAAQLEESLQEARSLASDLEAAERRLQLALDASGVGTFDWDVVADTLDWDERCREIFGTPPGEQLTFARFLGALHPDDRARTESVVRGVLDPAGDGVYETEYRVRWPDGSVRWVEARGRAYFGGSGDDRRATRFAGTVLDVTARKQTEEALRQAVRELSTTSYTIAHDLRSPLRAIDGYSHMLFNDYGERLDEPGRDLLRRLRANSQRMGRLIDGVLALARLGREPMRRERVDLSALASTALDVLRDGEPARRVELQVAPGIVADGDPRMLAVLVQNLVGNAWKFTRRNDEEGRAPARIEFGALDDGAERAFYVRDNGAGFDMAASEQLFQPFHRLHREEQYEGYGIGLATVVRIAERHGGRAWAESRAGAGATIFFTLGGEAPTAPL